MKRIKKKGNNWKCGKGCPRIARTDDKCNCVCIKNPTPHTKVWGWECTPKGEWKNLYKKLNEKKEEELTELETVTPDDEDLLIV